MERIVIVDDNDNFIGVEEKDKCHEGDGILHRGFLAMIFNGAGELLLARRSEKKNLWPGFWDGTVASHLFHGEDYKEASRRRLLQEMGLMISEIDCLFKFHYTVRYKDIGTENEICAVTMVRGIDTGGALPNNDEISDIRHITVGELMDDIREDDNRYTPWLRLAVKRMDMQQLI
ncbi:MAG TPA: NUDIX domain-containing protein [Thermodesulfovibrionales bacterium]|nr:NUDIX domain-containing protein [Thermodesulfovibrionales bacterium]